MQPKLICCKERVQGEDLPLAVSLVGIGAERLREKDERRRDGE